jgi:hypothetical protein
VQETCRRGAPRQYEGAQRFERAVQLVDLAFEPRNLRIAHLQAFAPILGLVGKAKIGAEVEQIVLNAREHGVERLIVARMQARKTDDGVGLVQCAVGLDPEVVFRHAPSRAERGRAVVAGARVYLVEDNHYHPPCSPGPAEFKASYELSVAWAKTGSSLRYQGLCPAK